jgi:hypothetical protein
VEDVGQVTVQGQGNGAVLDAGKAAVADQSRINNHAPKGLDFALSLIDC